jgi:hypothetical protein
MPSQFPISNHFSTDRHLTARAAPDPQAVMTLLIMG